MDEHTKYIERNDLKGASHLQVSVYYTKGGTSFMTGGTTPRGYYLSVKPVTKRDNMVSFVMFSGHRRLLLETSRFSAKQFSKAVEMAKAFEDELISVVLAESKTA